MTYAAFLERKAAVVPAAGVEVESGEVHPMLFDFQRDLVLWALRKGRAAIFADTGLGKTFMQIEWARLTGERALILAPLAVAQQTVREAARLGVAVTYARGQDEADGITITNYERLAAFDPSAFGAVVLDESSILKAHDGKTRTRLIGAFASTPFRLACTATPAPNDIAELANHSEFLSILTRTELLATFFVHDDNGWRMKRHARDPFYRWLSSWSMSVRYPSDLGFDDDGFILPPLSIESVIVESGWTGDGQLFPTGLRGIGERSDVRRATLAARVEAAVGLVAAEPKEAWLIWCGLNDEGRALSSAIPGSVLIEGADDPEVKAAALLDFAENGGVLITKPSIAGHGMNFQRCARMAFVGLSDSYEQYYQAIRRCWRFGQAREVRAFVVVSDVERVIYENVLRKEDEAKRTHAGLLDAVRGYEREELEGMAHRTGYETAEESTDRWTMKLGDCVERIAEVAAASVGLSVFSPPFQALYTYSASERDLGNSRDRDEFWEHFGYLIPELLRVTMPGRLCCVHVGQLATTLVTHGVIGLEDFRGATIRAFSAGGWTYHGEIAIDKNPQAQAIRTHAKGLLFVQKGKDSAWLRPALADYILVFRAPGENAEPVVSDVSNEEWIEFAHPVWYGIRETDTLNVAEARGPNDERHICPLQLPVIERCLRLWSNRGDLVLSPFAGIGSEGHEAVRLGRRFVGIELKPEYFRVAVRNLRRAEGLVETPTLMDSDA